MSGTLDGGGNFERLAALVDELRVRNTQLEHALSSRIAVEQAKGVLAERYALDVDAAFDLLRAAARGQRLGVHELASAVVTSPRTPESIALELAKRAHAPAWPAVASGAR